MIFRWGGIVCCLFRSGCEGVGATTPGCGTTWRGFGDIGAGNGATLCGAPNEGDCVLELGALEGES